MARSYFAHVPATCWLVDQGNLKSIYRAETAQAAALRLDEFEHKWSDKFPPIGQSWRRNWEQIIPFF
ncbi:MAG: IS256 family transposase, partial [Rhodospirillaceae bacterium]|nr:IS256 family transposase [Rhodospirillaceae bacterium]